MTRGMRQLKPRSADVWFLWKPRDAVAHGFLARLPPAVALKLRSGSQAGQLAGFHIDCLPGVRPGRRGEVFGDAFLWTEW